MHLKMLLTPEDFADDKNYTNHSERIKLSIRQMKHHTIKMYEGLEV